MCEQRNIEKYVVSEEVLEDYADMLQDDVTMTSGMEESVISFLMQAWMTVIGDKFRWSLKSFGSRRAGYALPSSDLDIVCELSSTGRPRCGFNDITFPLLRALMECLKRDYAECIIDRVTDTIESKGTVSFNHRRRWHTGVLAVDATIWVGDVNLGHSPSRITTTLKNIFEERPKHALQLAQLVVERTKRIEVCWNRRGSIKGKLKSIHWVLLTMAFWRAHPQCESSSLLTCFGQFFAFYLHLDFECARISAIEGEPFAGRPRSDEAVFLFDATGNGRNNLKWTTSEDLANIRQALRDIVLFLREKNVLQSSEEW